MALGGALGLVLVARDAVELFVADMAQGDIPLCFTWQAWHHLIWGFPKHVLNLHIDIE